jgi:hypothetical protein
MAMRAGSYVPSVAACQFDASYRSPYALMSLHRTEEGVA